MKSISKFGLFIATLAFAGVLVGDIRPSMAEEKRIAIAQFGPHPSLQQVVEGFKQEIKAAGISANYDEGHVNFDRSLVPQFLQKLHANSPDLMLTVTTPMTQSAKQILASRTYPIVFAPVTDPVQAGLVPSWESGSPMMTGASNIPDIDATIEFMKGLVPGLKRLGILYNPGDDSDNSFVSALENIVGAHDVELMKIGVDNVNDIPQRMRSFQGQADAVFIPASSLLQPASAAIASAANAIKIPVFSSNPSTVKDHHMLAAYTVDWLRVGRNAGLIGVRILNGEDPEDIAPMRPSESDHQMIVSGQRLNELGLTLPESMAGCDCVAE